MRQPVRAYTRIVMSVGIALALWTSAGAQQTGNWYVLTGSSSVFAGSLSTESDCLAVVNWLAGHGWNPDHCVQGQYRVAMGTLWMSGPSSYVPDVSLPFAGNFAKLAECQAFQQYMNTWTVDGKSGVFTCETPQSGPQSGCIRVTNLVDRVPVEVRIDGASATGRWTVVQPSTVIVDPNARILR